MHHILIVNTANQPVTFESRPSSTLDLIMLLPFLPVANRYPGLHPWSQELTERLSAAEQGDFALITRTIHTLLKNLPIDLARMEDAPSFLAALDQIPAERYQVALLKESLRDGEADLTALLAEPGRIRDALEKAPAPRLEEEPPLDLEQMLHLVAQPPQLKALFVSRLSELWEKHFRFHWERSLPTLARRTEETKRQFSAGTPEQVIQAVTGRPLPDVIAAHVDEFRTVILHPSSFLGPYAAMIWDDVALTLRAVFGGSFRPSDAELEAGHPSGMLPIMTALADEVRLQMLGLIRLRGQGCAQDFMTEFSLSQPATSRHLRLLESTGLVKAERIDGVKWYRINQSRARQVGASLQRFLVGE